MARKWKVVVDPVPSVSSKPESQLHDLRIEGLTDAQISFIRCMLDMDFEVDPVADWGFKKSDGDLQEFRMDLATELAVKRF
jgi:hypothetical protein